MRSSKLKPDVIINNFKLIKRVAQISEHPRWLVECICGIVKEVDNRKVRYPSPYCGWDCLNRKCWYDYHVMEAI